LIVDESEDSYLLHIRCDSLLNYTDMK